VELASVIIFQSRFIGLLGLKTNAVFLHSLGPVGSIQQPRTHQDSCKDSLHKNTCTYLISSPYSTEDVRYVHFNSSRRW
jgi:hypothetical protein